MTSFHTKKTINISNGILLLENKQPVTGDDQVYSVTDQWIFNYSNKNMLSI